MRQSTLRPGARVDDVQADRVLRELTVLAYVSPAVNNKKQGSFEVESSV